MELNLPPLATACQVSQQPFVDGQRVLSFLMQDPNSSEVRRADLLEIERARYQPVGTVICSWVHLYKHKAPGENRERNLKLTAESLFLTLADPTTEPSPENTRLLQFLALMMERKRLIKARGSSADGLRIRYEHLRTKQMIELPKGELTPEFFREVHEQLSVLVGNGPNRGQSQSGSSTPDTPVALPVVAEGGAKAPGSESPASALS